MTMLRPEQQISWQQNGFMVFNDYFTPTAMEQLKAQALTIVNEFDPNSTRAIFSTKNEATARDQYFLTSGDKIRCFFEEEAFNQDGQLTQPKALSINKIGHALHLHDPVFRDFSSSPRIRQICHAIGLQTPRIHQSMYIFKQPRIGGVVRWHQDATYFYTEPVTVTTFWVAIEDATVDNGCLMIAPNTANFPLKEQFKRYPDDSTELVMLDSRPWPKDEDASPIEVKAGSLVVFNGYLPHFSYANTSSKSRHAYTLHITCGSSAYAACNWLQTDPLSI